MPVKTITDRKGRQFEWDEYNGHGFFEVNRKFLIPEGYEAKMKKIQEFEIREDDILVCTYPKSGTHWIWEIVSMVTSKTPEYDERPKETLMLEFQSADSVASEPSPRILNTHFSPSCLPEQIVSKNTKIIHVTRNAKDIVTSYFHHLKQFNDMHPDDNKPFETFSEFLPYFTGEYGVYMMYSLWRYLKEMNTFASEHPGQVLTLRFEDMKANPTEAVRKVAEFLNKDLSADVIEKIAENCSFDKLKAANDTKKKPDVFLAKRKALNEKNGKKPLSPRNMYRKGIVGDWKNHFTVAESEHFDQITKEKLKDCDLKLT